MSEVEIEDIVPQHHSDIIRPIMAEKKTKQDFSQKEAQRLGYDFAVVQYFLKNDPDTLAFIWGSNTSLYRSILTNSMSNQELSGHVIGNIKIDIALREIAPLDDDEPEPNGYTDRAVITLARYRMANNQ